MRPKFLYRFLLFMFLIVALVAIKIQDNSTDVEKNQYDTIDVNAAFLCFLSIVKQREHLLFYDRFLTK